MADNTTAVSVDVNEQSQNKEDKQEKNVSYNKKSNTICTWR
jgi:hypothetical protein